MYFTISIGRYDINGGPSIGSLNALVDAFECAGSEKADERSLPPLRFEIIYYRPRRILRPVRTTATVAISGVNDIEREGESGESFRIAGTCVCDMDRSGKNHHFCQFEANYNAREHTGDMYLALRYPPGP